MSNRLVFALDLVDDAALIAEYERRHAPGAVWPAIIADIRTRGFLSMEIWRFADRLVMIADVVDDFPRTADASEQAVVQAWENAMDKYQAPILTEGPKWAPMARIFALEDQ